MPRLSIIIPTRHFDEPLSRRIQTSLLPLPAVEVLVVEPHDQAPTKPAADEVAAPPSPAQIPPLIHHQVDQQIRRLTGPRGRGTQCNAGARAASGEWLLFLHDDTDLPADALVRIEQAFSNPGTGAACFRLRFDHDHWLLGLYAAFSRFDSVFTTFGDQGLVIRRDLFDAIDGFPDWPLFEDVEIARRIRHRSRIAKLAASVTTSAVRFERNGMLRQQWLNAILLLRFLLGAKPQDLVARYERPGR